ncbi:MAG: hypothetical protein K2Y37_21090 [Pirellulales bacterium]|nr:hypothetical protein [Pirellulales bacterium]
MSIVSGLKHLYYSYCSKPETDRALYKAIRRTGAKRLLELGVGDCQRASRLIAAAAHFADARDVRYVGVDLFEARPAGVARGVSLKEAFRRLKATGAAVQLLPGNAFTALARSANALGPMDLIVISADQDADSLERAWFYVPRLLTTSTRVFRETVDGSGALEMRELRMSDIETLVSGRGRRAA